MEISSMLKDNVTKFPSSPELQKNHQITLETLKLMMSTWRSNKKNSQEQIPKEIWDAIFILMKTTPQTKIQAVTGIKAAQFKIKMRSSQIHTTKDHGTENSKNNELEFCETTPEKPSIPIAYKPAKAFATNTCIVELYRPDGMLMKIHICTESFNDLLSAFFKGSL